MEARARRPPSRRPRRAARSWAAREEVEVEARARSCSCAAAGSGAGLPSHLPAPARPGPGLRRRPEARALPARARDQPSLPLARDGGASRVDARVRRRRPDVASPRHLGGEEELRLLCEAGLGVVLDVVPNHMAASDEENPFWRDPLMRAKFFDLDWRTGANRRFFDIGELAGVRMEDPEVFEVLSRKVVELVRDGLVDGSPRRPSGRAREPGAVLPPPRRRRGRARLGREDPRARGAPAGLAGRGDDRLRVPERLDRALRRSCRRGALDPALPGVHGRDAGLRGDRRRGEARAGADDVRPGSGVARGPARRCRRRGRSGSGARVVPRLPNVRRARYGPRRRARPGGGAERTPAGSSRRDPAARGARLRLVRHSVPADDAAGDGEGGRGHRVLPLPPPRCAERGRGRSRPLLAPGRRVPCGEPRAGPALPAPSARFADARHEAKR